ncbi:MAG: alpha/beta hydrolase, partial [Novosphingobium sp.]|nr:alpha/beta hydrolase [Novosphingobium sp.]
MTDFIFQHGGMVGSHIWSDLVEAIAARSPESRFLLLDMPGCGTKRGLDPHGFTFQGAIDNLIADIDASGFSNAVLVGHSQGGTVLPRLVEARSNMFRRLVFIACIAPDPGNSIVAAARAAQHPEAAQMTIMDRLITLY